MTIKVDLLVIDDVVTQTANTVSLVSLTDGWDVANDGYNYAIWDGISEYVTETLTLRANVTTQDLLAAALQKIERKIQLICFFHGSSFLSFLFVYYCLMIIVGINKSSHNASVVLMKDNEIIFHIESERLSHIKYDKFPFMAMSKIKDYVDHVDVIALAGFLDSIPYDDGKFDNVYKSYILGLNKTFYNNKQNIKTYDFGKYHHATHAAIAFYNSGFDEALCVVKDGAGSVFKPIPTENPKMAARESSSFFKAKCRFCN